MKRSALRASLPRSLRSLGLNLIIWISSAFGLAIAALAHFVSSLRAAYGGSVCLDLKSRGSPALRAGLGFIFF